jgi:PhnB protein
LEVDTLTRATKPIPDGFRTITPHLVVRDAAAAIDFFRKAFGATERGRILGPDGTSIIHADIQIGDSHLFLVD